MCVMPWVVYDVFFAKNVQFSVRNVCIFLCTPSTTNEWMDYVCMYIIEMCVYVFMLWPPRTSI